MLRVFNGIFAVVRSVCKIMILVQVFCVTVVVIGRYGFNVTPPWGEELTLFCLVWLSLLGASLPLRNDTHLRIALLDKLLPQKALTVLDWLCYLVVIVFSVVIVVAGIIMTRQVSGTILYGMHISKGFLYAAVPTAGVFFLLALCERIYRQVKRLPKGGEEV